jgi:hypothetical protein
MPMIMETEEIQSRMPCFGLCVCVCVCVHVNKMDVYVSIVEGDADDHRDGGDTIEDALFWIVCVCK